MEREKEVERPCHQGRANWCERGDALSGSRCRGKGGKKCQSKSKEKKLSKCIVGLKIFYTQSCDDHLSKFKHFKNN